MNSFNSSLWMVTFFLGVISLWSPFIDNSIMQRWFSPENFNKVVVLPCVTAALIVYFFYYNSKESWGFFHTAFKFNGPAIKKLLSLGFPAAGQMLFEVGVFSLTSMLAGRLGAKQLAAHQIVLNIASFTFMVPLGFSAAAAIRVGQYLGQGERQKAKLAGWSALGIGILFMALSGICLFVFNRNLLGIFTSDQEVIALGHKLLIVAALFQVFDGTQVVGTGALRGVGNTKTPMLANFFGYWIIGLPIGATICFYFGGGVLGLWIGLTIGLIFVAARVLFSWIKSV